MSRSLIPHVFGQDFWDSWNYPPTIGDQDFGQGMAMNWDLGNQLPTHQFPRRNWMRSPPQNFDGFSNVVNDKNSFTVKVDCSHFKPEELTVKHVDNSITVNGKHEEKKDEHGFIRREFTRRYLLPKDIELDQMKSSLTPAGVLVISAPKKVAAIEEAKERSIPIQRVTDSKIVEQ